MAENIETVGTDAGQDRATLGAWEAARVDTETDDQTANITEAAAVDAGNTVLNLANSTPVIWKITSNNDASTRWNHEDHKDTPVSALLGSYARVVNSDAFRLDTNNDVIIEYLEIDGSGYAAGNIAVDIQNDQTGDVTVRYCVFHDLDGSLASANPTAAMTAKFHNNWSFLTRKGVTCDRSNITWYVEQCTFLGDTSIPATEGLRYDSPAAAHLKNNISIGFATYDYDTGFDTFTRNLSSDGTGTDDSGTGGYDLQDHDWMAVINNGNPGEEDLRLTSSTLPREWPDDMTFNFSFESGSITALSDYASSHTAGAGITHSVDADAAWRGGYGWKTALAGSVTNEDYYGLSTGGTTDESVFWAVAFDDGTMGGTEFVMADGDEFVLASLNDGFGCGNIAVRRSGANYQLGFYSNGPWHATDWVTISKGTTYLVKHRRVSNASTGVQYWAYQADGDGSWTVAHNHTGQNTSAATLDVLQIGVRQGLDTGTSGDFYVDHIFSTTSDFGGEPDDATAPYGDTSEADGAAASLTYGTDIFGTTTVDCIGAYEVPGGADTVTLDVLEAEGALVTPTLSPGSVTTVLDVVEAEAELLDPTLAPGTVSVALDSLAAEAALLTPTLSPGAVTLALGIVEGEAALLDPTLVTAASTIVLDVLGAEGELLDPTLTPGAVTLVLDVVEGEAALLDVTFDTATVIAIGVLEAEAALLNPTLTPGAVTVTLGVLAAEAALLDPTVGIGTSTIDLDALAAEGELLDPTFAHGEATLVLDVLAAEGELLDVAFLVPATWTGPLAAPLAALRTLLASTSECQTWLGVGSQAAAEERIYIGGIVSPTSPFVVLSIASFNFSRYASGARDFLRDAGVIRAQFFSDVAVDDLDSQEDAENTFLNDVSGILSAALDLSGSGTHLSVETVELEDVSRSHEDEQDDYYRGRVLVGWKA